jgi:predicted DNA-binding WGR domain protein
MELRSVNPESNRHRRYALATQFRLDGGGEIIVRWGRIGRRLRTRVESFATASALEHRYDELLARRRRHGYVVFPAVANDTSPPEVSPRPWAAVLDTKTRFLALRQSNGYTGVFDSELETFVVRDAELEVAAPIAHAFNVDPRRVETFLSAG